MDPVAAVRAFSRFYTQRLGVLDRGLLDSPYSLAEARVLYELADRGPSMAKQLSAELELDPAYVSRILSAFVDRGLARRKRSPDDGRVQLVSLTKKGTTAAADLDARSSRQVESMLARLSTEDRRRLVGALDTVERLLGEPATPGREPFVLRAHEPGDIGWVIHRHGVLYAHAHGYDERFEALVARILADFVDACEPQRERLWIAEQAGERVGCIACVAAKDEAADDVAQLRLLLVEPAARGQGLGKALVDECLRFAARCGYRRIKLWTQSTLRAAARQYERAGFRVVDETPHESWGQDLAGQIYEREL